MILVLEGLRGIAALFVAIYHSWPSGIRSFPLMINGWLWVDLFFVLSGSVMSYSYSKRITSKVDFFNFIIKRFGRLYPLHFFTTLAFICITLTIPFCAALLKNFLSLASVSPITSPDRLAQMMEQLPFHLLLVHGLGTLNQLDLNVPSWSISTEIAVYIAWATIWFCFRNKKVWLTIAMVATVVSLMILYFGVAKINFSYMNDYGILRCLAGFSIGTALPSLWLYLSNPIRKRFAVPCQIIGIAATAALFYFARSIPAATYLAPFVFAVLIVGLVAYSSTIVRFLSSGVFVSLGRSSYSVYLWHVPLLLVFKPLASISPNWSLELITLAYIFTLLALAKLSYKYIETPCRVLIANFADKTFPLNPKNS